MMILTFIFGALSVNAGAYPLEVSAPIHLAYAAEIAPIQGLSSMLLGAKRKTGMIVFQGARGKLYVNGRYWGRVPGRYQLRVGRNVIMVKNTEGVLLKKTVKVRYRARRNLMVRDPMQDPDMPSMDLEPMVALPDEAKLELNLEPLAAPADSKEKTEAPSMNDLELMPHAPLAPPKKKDPALSVLTEPIVEMSVEQERSQWLTSWWTWGGVSAVVLGATLAAVAISSAGKGPEYDSSVALDLREGVGW